MQLVELTLVKQLFNDVRITQKGKLLIPINPLSPNETTIT